MYVSVCYENLDPRLENWNFNHEAQWCHRCDIYQKIRLESRIQVICVSIAFARVGALIFSQNRHALRTVLVGRHHGIAHKSLQKSKNEILLCNWATLNNFYFMKKIDLLVKKLTLWSKIFKISEILLYKVIFLTSKNFFFIK